MRVEILLYILLVAVGDGQILVAEDDSEALNGFSFRHVDNVRAVCAQEFGTGQIVLHLLHVHQTHYLLTVSPTERSFIRITISADKHFIYCDIQNSNHPKTASDHSGHGIGLQQVERRLELAYPNHYTWEKGTKENNTIYYSTITIQL